MTTFASLNLSARLLDTLSSEGYETPTPIQAQAIPPVLEGRDLLGCAQTGTGKTAAFALPLIERLIAGGRPERKSHNGSVRRARALILAPTRELAAQIEDSLQTYGRRTGLRHVVIYGGVRQTNQVRQLRAGVDVIVATPGRLMDLMEQGHVNLGSIEMFILDEADRMLDMGFIEPIRQIGRKIPKQRQTLLFSATMPPKIRQLADAMLTDPVSVSVAAVERDARLIKQTLYQVHGEDKPALLTHLLDEHAVERTVVFTKTKHGAEKLAKKLIGQGVSADAIHGNKSQNQRERALAAFRSGRARVLVATDVAARGLDVDGITHVFNFSLPMEAEAYVHRIGRTGRAGATGHAISFCSRDERGLLRAIEREIGERIPLTKTPELDRPVYHASESRDSSEHREPRSGTRSVSRTGHAAAGRKESYPTPNPEAYADERASAASARRPGSRPGGRPGFRTQARTDGHSEGHESGYSGHAGHSGSRAATSDERPTTKPAKKHGPQSAGAAGSKLGKKNGPKNGKKTAKKAAKKAGVKFGAAPGAKPKLGGKAGAKSGVKSTTKAGPKRGRGGKAAGPTGKPGSGVKTTAHRGKSGARA